MFRGCWLTLGAALSVAMVAPVARAQQDVTSIVEHGVELRRQGRGADALAEFKRALAIQKSARVQAQVALAEQALGLWIEAEQDLLPVVSNSNGGHRDPWTKKNWAALTEALAVIQSHLGSLDVWGSPDGAELYVNRKLAGKLPLDRPLRVSGGTVLLTARAEGYIESTRTLTVPAGGTAREHVELLREVPAPAKVAEAKAELDARPVAGVGPGRSTSVETSEGPVAEVRRPAPAAEPAQGSALRPVGWVLGIGAVGALTFGVVETFARQHDKAAFNDYALPNPSDPAHPIASYCNTDNLKPECAPLQAAFDRSNRLMLVGYISAGALALSSAVVLWLSSSSGGGGPRDRPAESASAGGVRLACAPQLAAASSGVACRLAF